MLTDALGDLLPSAVGVAVASGADDPDSASSDTVDVVTLLLGVLFLVMAARQWRSRPKRGEEPAMPKWMAAVDQLSPVRSAVLGAALSGINPKNLALTLAAAGAIAQAGLTGTETAVAVSVFVVLGSLSVAGPVLFFLVADERARAPLAAVKEFMSEHNAAIMTVVLLVLGAKLLGNGIAGMTS